MALVAVCLTFLVGFDAMQDVEPAAFLFLLFSVTPYILISFSLYRSKRVGMIWVNRLLLMILSFSGIATLIYEMFFNKDAQSALAFIVIPLYQLFIYLLVMIPAYFIIRK